MRGDQGIALMVAGVCALLAVLEAATLWTALSWLRWWDHLGWVGLWSVRTVAYGLAAWWLWRDDRRGPWLAAAVLLTLPLLYLMPFADHAENQYHRRFYGTMALLFLVASARVERLGGGRGDP